MIELLLSLLVSLTGLERTVEPELTIIAQQRVVEISACPDELDSEGNLIPGDCWSHAGIRPGTAEVLAWNTQPTLEDATRGAVNQWRNSPDHWAILSDHNLSSIGCASIYAHDRYYFACILRTGTASVVPPQEPSPTPSPQPSMDPAVDPGEVFLPDTRMSYEYHSGSDSSRNRPATRSSFVYCQ